MSYEGKNILAVVPARGGSKGIPKKNLLKIGELSLIGWVGKVIDECRWIDYAVISTDDKDIQSEGLLHGLDAPFLRPDELSTDTTSSLDTWQHAHLRSEEHRNTKFDCTILLEPTSLFRKSCHIETVIKKLIDQDYDSVVTVSRTDSKYHPLKQLQIENGNLRNYDEATETIIYRQQLSPLFHRNGVAYCLTRECLLDQKEIFGANTSAVLIEEPVVNIDTMWDVRVANWLYSDMQ